MDLNFLDFEQPIAELEAKIDELRFVGDDSKLNISEEIDRLKQKSESLTRNIFSSLSPQGGRTMAMTSFFGAENTDFLWEKVLKPSLP